MNTLTPPAIAVPQIGRMRVRSVQPDVDDGAVYVSVQVQSPAGVPYPEPGRFYILACRNGTSQGIRASLQPVGFTDRVEVFTLSTPTGFTDVLAANVGATLAIRNSSVETALIAAGLMPAGVVT